ncbi:hypothetical protein Trydic_g14308 [Trypoxylus dichotomus]
MMTMCRSARDARYGGGLGPKKLHPARNDAFRASGTKCTHPSAQETNNQDKAATSGTGKRGRSKREEPEGIPSAFRLRKRHEKRVQHLPPPPTYALSPNGNIAHQHPAAGELMFIKLISDADNLSECNPLSYETD